MLLKPETSLLLLVDLQERLLAAMSESEAVIRKASLLVSAAKQFSVPVVVSEQYPRGLGPTVKSIADQVMPDARHEKMEFSVFGNATLAAVIEGKERNQIVVAGVEAHVCVLQTALNAVALGYETYVVADAIASRHDLDKTIALERIRANNIHVVTAEMVAFEWIGSALSPNFKVISNLIK